MEQATTSGIYPLTSNKTDDYKQIDSKSGFTKMMLQICKESTGSINTIERQLLNFKIKRRNAFESRRNLKKKLKKITDDILSNEDIIDNCSLRIIELEKTLRNAELKQLNDDVKDMDLL